MSSSYISPSWPAPAKVKAYTTLKSAWGGRKQYIESQPSAAEADSLEKILALPSEPIWLTQTHTTKVIEAKPEHKEENADASYTTQPGRICVVLTADCLPLFLCNKAGTKIAAIHAGWRGLAAGIIENTVDALQTPGDELLAWLGPAIGPKKFEVGKDVYDTFVAQHPESATAFLPHAPGKWLANLYELAKIRLGLKGLTQVYGGEYCTYSQEDMFFSYRRDHGKTGRMASLIWIEKD